MKILQVHQLLAEVGSDVLSGYLGLQTSAKENKRVKTPIAIKEVSVIIQIIGQLKGQVICSMKLSTVKKIVGRMMGGMVIDTIDEMGWSAIQEFGNWIASGIATKTSAEGILLNITHPIVNQGQSILRTKDVYTLVPLSTEIGIIDVYMSIEP